MRPAVIDRSKHDKRPRLTGAKLAAHPAMKELARMIQAGEIDPDRTLAHLKSREKPTP
jgi:hypothetical protein